MDSQLTGTWFVVRSSLSMWRKRTDVSLNYLPLPGGEVGDVVQWRSGTGFKRIVGIDTPDGAGWRWRGVGAITRFTTSRWRFVALDPQGEWAVSRFEKTPFTAAGTDLCFRGANPSEDLLAAATAACAEAAETAEFAPHLFDIRHG